MAGPRERIFFEPAAIAAGIVTCGGLCPGINNVIRAVVLSLHHHYGVRKIYGFRYGYEGLVKRLGHTPLDLTPELVDRIGELGGTILASSRGPQDPAEMVDTLEELGVGILFAIGGDGTLKGAGAIAREAVRRRAPSASSASRRPSTTTSPACRRTFGFETAVTEAQRAIYAAHTEALGARNGIGLVKLMGRDSGFIAAFSSLVDSQVNFCLVPEVPFTLAAFLTSLHKRLETRGHAVIVVAEGAGQELMPTSGGRDASGNVKLRRHRHLSPRRHQGAFCPKRGGDQISSTSTRATSSGASRQTPTTRPSVYCSGTTPCMRGWRDERTWWSASGTTSSPMFRSASPPATRKKIDPEGRLWSSVLASTGQPREML